MSEDRVSAEQDALARRAACSVFDRPMVLEAGAGTGKTAVLVERVATWCLGPGFEQPGRGLDAEADLEACAGRVLDGVVALTFSEAAAAEMEERIAGRLFEVARNPAAGAPVGLRPRVDEELAGRARALLANLDRLAVRTIHAFCRRLLASFPLEAGLHPHFRIDTHGELRGRIAREQIEALLQSANSEEQSCVEALSERGVGAPDLEGLLRALLASGVTAAQFAIDPLGSAALQAWWQRLQVLLERCAVADTAADDGPKSAGRERLARAVEASRKLLGAGPGGAPHALAELLTKLRSHWEPLANPLRTAASQTDAFRELRTFFSTALRLDPEGLSLLHRVLATRFAVAEERVRAEGGETFEGLLRRSRDLLRDEPQVLAQVRRGIAQLLVDEFQDTDPLQCEIVELLALDGDPSQCPVLFVVGDPKQSIYAWRNADLAAYDGFLSKAQRRGAQRHALVVNHRSLPRLLAEVETLLRPLMIRDPGLQPGFQALLASAANREREERAQRVPSRRPAAGRSGSPERRWAQPVSVEYWISNPPEGESSGAAAARDLEALAIARDLLRARASGQLRWRDAAILLRSTGDLEHYLEALRRMGIPFAVDRDRIYYRRREVLEAAALLRSVLDPNDQLALVATLRSVRCGVPDAAWLPLWRAGFPGAVRRALAEGGTLEACERAVRAARREVDVLAVPGVAALGAWEESLLEVLDLLRALREAFLREPFDCFLDRCRRWALFDPSEGARHLGPYRLANLDRFFREVARLDDVVAGDRAAMLRALRRAEPAEPGFDEGRPRDASEDAVQVMTIHGAKGLSFDWVYLAQAHKGSASRPGNPFDAGEVDGRAEYQLRWGPGRQQALTSLSFDRVAERRFQVNRAELVRTLYVAMTRAKSRLVIAGCLDVGLPARQDSHATLLTRTLAPEIERARSAVEASGSAETVLDGRRFVFLAKAASTARTAPRPEVQTVSVEEVARDAERLATLRAAARRRAGRPFSEAPSAAAQRERRAMEFEGGAVPPEFSRAAGDMAGRVGTAVHAFLERFEWAATDHQSEARCQWESTRARLTAVTPPAELPATLERAQEILDRLRAGPLWERLRELAPHVLGREVRVLARPESFGTGPVGYRAGAIDLLYRDPFDGRIVVADFKTDRVRGTHELREKTQGYRTQGSVYCRAVAEALALQELPRFELWFLHAGEIVPLAP